MQSRPQKKPVDYVAYLSKRVIEQNRTGNLHFFVNSVEFIGKAIKKAGLTPDQVKIVCADNTENCNKLGGLSIEMPSDPVKKVNFYTSTAFEGCDIYDKDEVIRLKYNQTNIRNPVTGCSKYTAGCENCYAYAMACRLQAIGNERYRNGFNVTLHHNDLSEPKYEAEPLLIFVCSMADLFHERVPFEFIDKVMSTIESTPRHTYQILTKRAERMGEYFATRRIPSNVWLGVTVENSKVKYRIDILRNLNALIRFLSCEPLLEDLGDIDLENID